MSVSTLALTLSLAAVALVQAIFIYTVNVVRELRRVLLFDGILFAKYHIGLSSRGLVSFLVAH
jgi:hypothetical protein